MGIYSDGISVMGARGMLLRFPPGGRLSYKAQALLDHLNERGSALLYKKPDREMRVAIHQLEQRGLVTFRRGREFNTPVWWVTPVGYKTFRSGGDVMGAARLWRHVGDPHLPAIRKELLARGLGPILIRHGENFRASVAPSFYGGYMWSVFSTDPSQNLMFKGKTSHLISAKRKVMLIVRKHGLV